MRYEALLNAAIYTALGLAVFAGAVKVLRPAQGMDMPDAVLRAAAILGCAWIIASTLH